MQDRPVDIDTLNSYFEAKQKVGYYSLILDECRYKIRIDPEKSLSVLAQTHEELGLDHDVCFEFIGDAILHLIDNPEALERVDSNQAISQLMSEIGMSNQYFEQMKQRALSFWNNELKNGKDE